jgi:hypothetical protein
MVARHHEVRRNAGKNLHQVAIHRAQLHHRHSRLAVANEEDLRRAGAGIGENRGARQKDSIGAAVQQNARGGEHAGLERQVLIGELRLHRNGARVRIDGRIDGGNSAVKSAAGIAGNTGFDIGVHLQLRRVRFLDLQLQLERRNAHQRGDFRGERDILAHRYGA